MVMQLQWVTWFAQYTGEDTHWNISANQKSISCVVHRAFYSNKSIKPPKNVCQNGALLWQHFSPLELRDRFLIGMLLSSLITINRLNVVHAKVFSQRTLFGWWWWWWRRTSCWWCSSVMITMDGWMDGWMDGGKITLASVGDTWCLMQLNANQVYFGRTISQQKNGVGLVDWIGDNARLDASK